MNKWDERFMNLAETVASWSSCFQENRHVGAVVVKDKRILTTGYNGASSGIESCAERGECLRRVRNIASGTMQEVCYAVHAEQNAIVQASKLGIPVDEATIYVTHQPCTTCTKLIINSGIKRIVYGLEYPDTFSQEFIDGAEIEMKYMPYEEKFK